MQHRIVASFIETEGERDHIYVRFTYLETKGCLSISLHTEGKYLVGISTKEFNMVYQTHNNAKNKEYLLESRCKYFRINQNKILISELYDCVQEIIKK